MSVRSQPPGSDPLAYVSIQQEPVADATDPCATELVGTVLRGNWYIKVTFNITINYGDGSTPPQTEPITQVLDPHGPIILGCLQYKNSTASATYDPTSLKASWDHEDPLTLLEDAALSEFRRERLAEARRCPLFTTDANWRNLYEVTVEPQRGHNVAITFRQQANNPAMQRFRLFAGDQQAAHRIAGQLVCSVPSSVVDLTVPWEGGILYFQFQYCTPDGWKPFDERNAIPIRLRGATGDQYGSVFPEVGPDGNVAMEIEADPPGPGPSAATISW
jgi:hypothetical protein